MLFWGRNMLLGLVPIRTWLIDKWFYRSSFVLAHTNSRVAGRDGCLALDLGILVGDWFHSPALGSLAPSLGTTGLASPFSPVACQLCILLHLIAKAKGFGVESPARNDYVYFMLSEQFSMELAIPTAVRSPVETMGIWGQVLVSVRESESCGALAQCRNGLPRMTFNVMTLAWDMKCKPVRTWTAWAVNCHLWTLSIILFKFLCNDPSEKFLLNVNAWKKVSLWVAELAVIAFLLMGFFATTVWKLRAKIIAWLQ